MYVIYPLMCLCCCSEESCVCHLPTDALSVLHDIFVGRAVTDTHPIVVVPVTPNREQHSHTTCSLASSLVAGD